MVTNSNRPVEIYDTDRYQWQPLGGWAGRWCRVASGAGGVLQLLHILGQGPVLLAEGAGLVGCIFIFFIYLPFLMPCLLGDG